MKVKVDHSWLEACGKPINHDVFDIIRTWTINSHNLEFAEVIDANGHPWTVCVTWRGQFLPD